MVEDRRNHSEERHASTEESEIKLSVSPALFKQFQTKMREGTATERCTQLVDTYYDDANFSITNLNRGLRMRSGSNMSPVLEFKSLFYIPTLRPQNPWLIEEKTFHFPMQESAMQALGGIFSRLQKPFSIDSLRDTYESEDIHELLKNNDLEARIAVKKDRTEYRQPNCTFVFDEIEGLGYFVEVETHDRSNPLDTVRNLINSEEGTVVREGYNDMIIAGNPAIVPIRTRMDRFTKQPDWNVLTGEGQVIADLLKQ